MKWDDPKKEHLTTTLIRMIEFKKCYWINGEWKRDIGFIEFRNVILHTDNQIEVCSGTASIQYDLIDEDNVIKSSVEQHMSKITTLINSRKGEIEECTGKINNWEECIQKVHKRLLDYYQKIIVKNSPLSYEFL